MPATTCQSLAGNLNTLSSRLMLPCSAPVGQATGTHLQLRLSDADDAAALTDRNFDQHRELQREAFLEYGRQDEAKYHGKLRTKFDRLVLSLHILSALCCLLSPFGKLLDFARKGHTLYRQCPILPRPQANDPPPVQGEAGAAPSRRQLCVHLC